jgi:hypothetical protein
MKRAVLGLSVLSMVALVGGCDDGGVSLVTMGPPAGSPKTQYIVSKLTVPASRTTFAYDLNGDGNPDNQLGNILVALKAQMLDTQMAVDDAFAGGQIVILVDEVSTDPNFKTDTAAASNIYVGNQTPKGPDMGFLAPDLTGNGMFTINNMIGQGNFLGRITNSVFNSNSPVTAKTPVQVSIKIPLVANADPVELAVTGAHLSFTRSGTGLVKGQLNGAMTKMDVETKIIPNIAKLLDQRVFAAPTDMTNKQTLMIFDTGGKADPACGTACKNPTGTLRYDGSAAPMCAVASDGRIDLCEVSTNSIIVGVLNPDVQLFQDGVYNPSPANKMKDSLSLGIGFEAVKATFQ